MRILGALVALASVFIIIVAAFVSYYDVAFADPFDPLGWLLVIIGIAGLFVGGWLSLRPSASK